MEHHGSVVTTKQQHLRILKRLSNRLKSKRRSKGRYMRSLSKLLLRNVDCHVTMYMVLSDVFPLMKKRYE